MPFFRFAEIASELVTPKHSRARGPLVTGRQIEVGLLRFGAGEGADPHHHAQEQVVVVLKGRLRVLLDGIAKELQPGDGFLAPSNAVHETRALEDTEVLSCKALVDGVGHRI